MKGLSFSLIPLLLFGAKIEKEEIKFNPDDIRIEYKDGYSFLSLKGWIFDNPVGAPQIPSFPYAIILPENAEVVRVDVTYGDSTIIPLDKPVYPTQPPQILLFKKDNIPFYPPKSSFYALSQYPLVEKSEFSWGNLGCRTSVNIILRPIRYLPHANLLLFFKKAEISIEYHPEPKPISITKENQIEYLIITSELLIDEFQKLKQWKEKKGLQTEIRTKEWIEINYSGRDLAEKIRNYLKELRKDSGLVWVLLGGDTKIIPVRKAFAMSCKAGFHPREDSLPVDLYFSDLDGDWDANKNGVFGEVEDNVDLYPDVWVGRAPVKSEYEVKIFIQKLLDYETNPNRDYQNNLLFLGEILWHEPFTDGGKGKDRIDSLCIPDNYSITKLYQSKGNENPNSVKKEIEKGKGFINHSGHGWIDVMSVGDGRLTNSDMLYLKNERKYGILFSVGCWTGAFDYECIGEVFVKNPKGGGIAYIGNSSYGWGSPGNPGFGYSDIFDEEFCRKVFMEKEQHIGKALAEAKAKFIPYSKNHNIYRWHQYQINLLGDPELTLWLFPPKKLEVVLPNFATPGETFHIQVLDSSSNMVATLTDEKGLIAKAWVDKSGKVTFKIPETSPPYLYLTITSPYHIPYFDTIHIIYPAVHIYYSNSLFSDSLYNGDGFINAGDTLLISLDLENSGLEKAQRINLSLHSFDSFIKVLDSTEYLDALKPQEKKTLKNAFSIVLLSTSKKKANLRLKIKEKNEWEYPMSFVIGHPLVDILCFKLSKENGKEDYPMPGRSYSFKLKFANKGGAILYQPTLTFTPLTSGISFLPQFVKLSNLRPEETAEIKGSLKISSSLKEGELVKFNAEIIGDEGHFSKEFCFLLGKSGFYEGFEKGLTKWEDKGEPKLWHCTTLEAWKGNYSLYYGYKDSLIYPNNANGIIKSISFVVPVNPILTFYRKFEFPIYGWDGLYVEISHKGRIDIFDFIGSGGALEIRDGWAEVKYFLNKPAGDTVSLRFRFVSDNAITAKGIFIDEVKVSGEPIFEDSEDEEETSGIRMRILQNPSFRVVKIEFKGPPEILGILRIYDIEGKLITQHKLKSGELFIWRGVNNRGEKVPSGIYFAVLRAGKQIRREKLIFIH